MPVKMQFLRSHLEYFPENCEDFNNEEQGERFPQDFLGTKERYQGRRDVSFGRLLLASEEGCTVCSAQQKFLKRSLIQE